MQRKEIQLPLQLFYSKKSIMNICPTLMIGQKRLEERRLKIIRLNFKKEKLGNLCIMEENLLIRLKRPMEQI